MKGICLAQQKQRDRLVLIGKWV